MASDRYELRRNRLLRRLKKESVDALLVTSEINVRYLTGFSGDSSYLLLGQSLTVLISDSRYTTQISDECPGLDTAIRGMKNTIVDVTAKVARQAKLKKLGFESHITTVADFKTLQEKIKQLELVPVASLVEELRTIKDAHEIGEIREAVRQAERGLEVIRASLVGSATELQVAHDLEHAMRHFGAERAGFDPIVAAGPRAALPHARPGKSRIDSANLLLIDWGSETTSCYRSDLTRVWLTGKISPKVEKIYRVVLNAQRRAISKIRPGARCSEVDAVARKSIGKAGFGKYFGHGLGHGIGLQIHEQPRFSPISEDVLKPGMVVTVEPGIYIPGWGGVRIEDDILVTRNGHEVLTSVPKEFDDAVVAVQ